MANGFPQVVLVGLPDAVVRQSVDRVRAAIVNAGGTFPQRRITIGLSPAAMPKQGSGFDLALAAAVLAASGTVPAGSVDRLVLLGELDIVARDRDALVFCEVKTRRGIGFGHPVEAVNAIKQRRLRTLGQRWLTAHDEHAPELRFDIVGVLVRPGRPALVTHLRAAF